MPVYFVIPAAIGYGVVAKDDPRSLAAWRHLSQGSSWSPALTASG